MKESALPGNKHPAILFDAETGDNGQKPRVSAIQIVTGGPEDPTDCDFGVISGSSVRLRLQRLSAPGKDDKNWLKPEENDEFDQERATTTVAVLTKQPKSGTISGLESVQKPPGLACFFHKVARARTSRARAKVPTPWGPNANRRPQPPHVLEDTMVNPTPTPDSVDMTHRSPVEIPKGLDPKSEPGSALTEANRRIAACVAEIAEARDNGFDEGRDSRLPGWMFWLALVVALGLGAFAGWQWYDGGKTLATTQNDLKTANNNLSAANINLEAVKAERDDLKVKVDARPKEIEDARTDGYSRGFDQAHNVYSCLNNEAGLEVSRINATTWALYCKEWSGDPAALFCTTAEGATTVDPEVDTCERGTFEERESQCSDEPTVASVLAGNGWVVDCGKDAAAYFCPWANEAGVDPDTDQCASY